DPAQLAPYKVDDYPHGSYAYTGAGHGFFATQTLDDPPVYNQFAVWNLATKQKTLYNSPGGEETFVFGGITRHHVYVVLEPMRGTPVDRIVRFPLPAGT